MLYLRKLLKRVEPLQGLTNFGNKSWQNEKCEVVEYPSMGWVKPWALSLMKEFQMERCGPHPVPFHVWYQKTCQNVAKNMGKPSVILIIYSLGKGQNSQYFH